MAIQGIVSSLGSVESDAIPGDEWFADLAGLSPAPNHLLIRASVSVDSANHVHMGALKRSLQAYKDADFSVALVLHEGLETRYLTVNPIHYAQAMPNAVLGYKDEATSEPDYLRNDYIEKYSLSCVGTLQALGDLCPQTVFVWNEPNLDDPALLPGQVPHKPTSLSAEVFGALLATTTKRIKDSCPLVTTIIPASYTCLIKYNTDPHGPWVGGHIRRALAYMARYGVTAPYDFSCLSLNMEGIITDKYAQWCAQSLTDIMRDNKITGQTVIGEWGIANHDAQDDTMQMTFSALDDHFSTMYLYNHGTLNAASYGTTLIGTTPDGLLVPRGHTPWYARFQGQLQTRAVT